MDKLLGYTDWVWDESEVFDSEHCGLCNQELYPCDLAYQEYADWKIGDLLPELVQHFQVREVWITIGIME